MIGSFVNDKITFNQVRDYIDNYFAVYAITRIKENTDTEGLHHAYRVIADSFTKMQAEFGDKPARKRIDHTR